MLSSNKAKKRAKAKAKVKRKDQAKQVPSAPKTQSPANKQNAKKKTMLAQADILPVVKRQKTKFQKCAEVDTGLKGKFVQVRIQIESNGKVTSVRPITKVLRKSPQKQCVINIVKGLKFPSFAGDPQTVPIPIRF